MTKKDYTIKFYKGHMVNDNQEEYNFYLAARSESSAYDYLEKYIMNHSTRYHIIPGENEIANISLRGVSAENYGKSYGYEVIN